jgi:hypothetical protein
MTLASKPSNASLITHSHESLAHAPEPSGVRRVLPNVSLHSYLPTQEPQHA